MRTIGLDLNQVTLPARDLSEAVDFYTRFGLRQIVDSPGNGYARFEIPGSHATLSIHAAPGAGVVDGATATIYFEVADPAEAIAALAARGITPIAPLEDKPWLWREASFRDPSGNPLILYHAGENRKNPPWRVAP